MTDQPRIGLYICHCGLNIAGVLDPEALAAAAQDLPGVAVCRHHLYSCSEAGQKDIQKDIQDFSLNRVVLAACSPKLHETTFRRLLQESGLNPYLLEIVNLREHCSWVHAGEPEAAAAKALDLIRMGLAKVRERPPLEGPPGAPAPGGPGHRRGCRGSQGRPGHRPRRLPRDPGGARPGAGGHGQPVAPHLSPGAERPEPD